MKTLIDYINQFALLDQEAIDELCLRAEEVRYKKGEYILEVGQHCNTIWFLKKGMVRKYYLHDGKEITAWIHTEGEIFTSLQSYAQDTLSTEYLEACEDCELIGISRQNSEKLSRFPQFVTFSNALMEKQFVLIDINTKEFNTKDARGKYEYLRKIAPEMVTRAKLHHIASLMGISPETLSRIRKN